MSMRRCFLLPVALLLFGLAAAGTAAPVRRERVVLVTLEGMSLDDLRASLGVELEVEGFETISGLIYSVLGRIPQEGESIEVSGLKLDVVKADTRRIQRVRVRRLVETPAP